MSGTLSGKKVGKYVIKEKLGSGGMAEVYKGYQENLDRFVAIKMMHAFLISDQDFLKRFQREARAMASLNHPNIVGVYDFDVYEKDSYYLVMEYVRGGTLKERLEQLAQNGERILLADAVKMVAEIADALAYAHRREMVHRDIKPANIMLNEETGRAVLTDFGIVKLLGNQAMAYTATGALIGTPAYMSPEQALGKSGDHRVDIYSLGVMLFQMVTGILPFDADTPLAIVMQHVNTPTPLPDSIIPDIPWGLQEVILKAMAKIPEDRFESAGAFAAALRAVDLSGTVSKSTGVTPPPVPISQDTLTPAKTKMMVPESETAVSPPSSPAEQPKKRPAWLFPVIGVVVLAVIAAVLAISGVFTGSSTPTTSAIAVVAATSEPTLTNTPRPTNTQAPDAAATSLAQLLIDLTAAARSTETATPSKTPTATATTTATADATSQFLLNCQTDVELISNSRSGFISNAVTTGFNFTAAWVLKNSGSCPWPADLQWEYVEGETFDYDGDPIPLEESVAAGDEISLTAPFRGPEEPGTYESSWQLVDADGEAYGEPVTFEFRAFLPVTSTPIPTATPDAPPTTAAVDGQVNWIFSVGFCNYLGGSDDWRCQVTITPYIDGSDQVGDFTLFIFDLPGGQATVYRGTGPFDHFVSARRCSAYNQEIRLVDDVTGTELSAPLYIDPNDFFENGCTEP
jgi:serine/threonine protein kinase